MKAKFAYVVILGALLLTVITLLAYDYLPKRTWVVMPDEDAWYAHYADELEGGPSRSEWVDDKIGHWRCRVEPEGSFVYCGMNVLTSVDNQHGRDLSKYDQVHLSIRPLTEPGEMRLFMRHYDPLYSSQGDGNSPQFIQFNIRSQDLAEPMIVGLNEFTVADWWLAERDVPRELSRPNFSNIIALGLDYRNTVPPGNHDVIIEEIKFVGNWISAEHWYLGIIVTWLGAIFGVSSVRLVSLHRASRRDRRRLMVLASRHKELAEEAHKYKELSTRDPLTGVYNRYGFEKVVQSLLADSYRAEASLIMIDIDHFKRINDTRGHNAGDEIIVRLAQIIYTHTREQDALCRWGGEEFVLLCPNTSGDNAFVLAEKIRNIISDSEFDGESPLAVSASFGVCEIAPGEDFRSALSRADRALYRAKALGRNCTLVAEGD